MRLAIMITMLLAAAPAAAADLSVAQFLRTAAALEKKGVGALFSSDYKLLRNELKTAGDALRADQVSARKGGRRPIACLPPKGKAAVGAAEVLAHFRTIPPAQRTMTAKAAFGDLMRRKYPCPN